MENPEKKDNKKGLVVALFAVLALVIGVLIYLNIEKTQHIEDQTLTIDEKSKELKDRTQELTDLKTEFENIRADNAALGIKNDSLDMRIKNLNTMLAEIKTKNAANYKPSKDFEKRLSSLRGERDKLLSAIAVLKQQNDSLNANVQTLSTEKSNLQTAFNDSINSFGVKKTELERQVAIASILKAENFKVQAMDSKGKIRDGEEFKAKRVEKLKITFSLADNKVAKKNTKTVMMKLTDPTGHEVYDIATGGGTFEMDGKKVAYTSKQTFDFSNSKQEVSFGYVKGSEYLRGLYKIDIYCEGFHIGETTFTVK